MDLVTNQDLPEAFLKYKCANCGKKLDGALLGTGGHHRDCALNYYFDCSSCGKINPLSRLSKKGCSCPDGWVPKINAESVATDLNQSVRCRRCKRPLIKPQSVERGIGPICINKILSS